MLAARPRFLGRAVRAAQGCWRQKNARQFFHHTWPQAGAATIAASSCQGRNSDWQLRNCACSMVQPCTAGCAAGPWQQLGGDAASDQEATRSWAIRCCRRLGGPAGSPARALAWTVQWPSGLRCLSMAHHHQPQPQTLLLCEAGSGWAHSVVATACNRLLAAAVFPAGLAGERPSSCL